MISCLHAKESEPQVWYYPTLVTCSHLCPGNSVDLLPSGWLSFSYLKCTEWQTHIHITDRQPEYLTSIQGIRRKLQDVTLFLEKNLEWVASSFFQDWSLRLGTGLISERWPACDSQSLSTCYVQTTAVEQNQCLLVYIHGNQPTAWKANQEARGGCCLNHCDVTSCRD